MKLTPVLNIRSTIKQMTSSKLLGISIIAMALFFAAALSAGIPGINDSPTGIPQVHAADSNKDKECLSSSSALFFDSRSIEIKNV